MMTYVAIFLFQDLNFYSYVQLLDSIYVAF